MSRQPSAGDLASTLEHLSINTSTKPSMTRPGNRAPVAESWDDDELAGSDTETDSPATTSELARTRSNDYPKAPPPTPSSPSMRSPATNPSAAWGGRVYTSLDGALTTPNNSMERSSLRGELEKRPEKSTAVASRLIAAGLGVKAPKRTEEQREYEKAVRAQERRKKEREIEDRNRAKIEAEKAKAAIWED